jgi:small-conductance mechanosensitive channel
VVNWSFSDKLVRLDVDFGVSYDSDPHEVTRLAISAATSVDRVLSTRPPVCWMTQFGASSLDFKLRFWISDPQAGLTNVRGKVLIALWDIFKENGVQHPLPAPRDHHALAGGSGQPRCTGGGLRTRAALFSPAGPGQSEPRPLTGFNKKGREP